MPMSVDAMEVPFSEACRGAEEPSAINTTPIVTTRIGFSTVGAGKFSGSNASVDAAHFGAELLASSNIRIDVQAGVELVEHTSRILAGTPSAIEQRGTSTPPGTIAAPPTSACS